MFVIGRAIAFLRNDDGCASFVSQIFRKERQMRLALVASPVMAAVAAVALGACSDDREMASNDRVERTAPVETSDYRYAPPSTTPDLRDIPPPIDVPPSPGQPREPNNPLTTPPASPPPVLPAPADSAPG